MSWFTCFVIISLFSFSFSDLGLISDVTLTTPLSDYTSPIRIPFNRTKNDQLLTVKKEDTVCLNESPIPNANHFNKSVKFPHRVALGSKSSVYTVVYLYDRIWFCGGTLISDKFVLTAANCLTKLNRINVSIEFASVETDGKLEDPEKSRYNVSRVFPHPQYKPPSIYHDIALIELDRPVEFNEFVKPACLYSGEDLESRDLTTSGWMLSFYGTTYKKLEEADLFLVSKEECQNAYKDFPKRLPYGVREEVQICAAEYIEDYCKSESGSPLEFTENNNTYIVGIKAFGNTCNLDNIPVVYTLIKPYVPWIESVVKNNPNNNLTISLDLKRTRTKKIENTESTENLGSVLSDRKCLSYREDIDTELREHKLDFIPGGRGAIGGVDAFEGEFPHMTALGYSASDNITNDISWKCGGNLISEKFVLTAAHCLTSRDLGPVKWAQLDYETATYQILLRPEQIVYKVKRRIRHPMYKRPFLYHDIALLELERNVAFDQFVRPACLYANPYIDQNVTLIATGWGLTETGQPSITLQKVYLDIFSNSECNDSFKGWSQRRLTEGIVEERQICAGKRKGIMDTCQGDSGGALQFKTPGYEFMSNIVGVVSFGKGGCGFEGSPGVYTRVATYIPWIESIVWPEEYRPQ